MSFQSPQFYRIARVVIAVLMGVLAFAIIWEAFDSFHSYLWAVGKHWVSLMSGIVSVGITFYEKVRQSLGKYALYVLAGLCVLFAGFQAWDDEHQTLADSQNKVTHLQTENDAYSKPLLWVDAIGQTCIHYGQDGTYLFIPMSIMNQGADSDGFVQPWVDYHSPTLDAVFPVFNVSVAQTECAFHTSGGDKRLVIRNNETIVARAHRGIKRYHHVEGRLPVKIVGQFGTQRQELESQQVRIKLCVKDGNGTNKCTTYEGPFQRNGEDIATLNDDEVRSVGPQKY